MKGIHVWQRVVLLYVYSRVLHSVLCMMLPSVFKVNVVKVILDEECVYCIWLCSAVSMNIRLSNAQHQTRFKQLLKRGHL